jgi:hypothetical protein
MLPSKKYVSHFVSKVQTDDIVAKRIVDRWGHTA